MEALELLVYKSSLVVGLSAAFSYGIPSLLKIEVISVGVRRP